MVHRKGKLLTVLNLEAQKTDKGALKLFETVIGVMKKVWFTKKLFFSRNLLFKNLIELLFSTLIELA